LLTTERNTSVNDNGIVDGWMRLAGENTRNAN
jgi:hypothetical protein